VDGYITDQLDYNYEQLLKDNNTEALDMPHHTNRHAAAERNESTPPKAATWMP
jgi:hypothetical protein